jgi:hypothetical protein
MHLHITVDRIVATVNDDLKDDVGAVNGIAEDPPRVRGDQGRSNLAKAAKEGGNANEHAVSGVQHNPSLLSSWREEAALSLKRICQRNAYLNRCIGLDISAEHRKVGGGG